MSDSMENRRKRLRFRCHHTGMKENNLLLGAFVDRHLAELSDDDVVWFESLLEGANDLDLFKWITGKEPAPTEYDHPVMRRLVDFRYVS